MSIGFANIFKKNCLSSIFFENTLFRYDNYDNFVIIVIRKYLLVKKSSFRNASGRTYILLFGDRQSHKIKGGITE